MEAKRTESSREHALKSEYHNKIKTDTYMVTKFANVDTISSLMKIGLMEC